MSILKRNRSDDKEIDISNLKYVHALIVYIIELENKMESVYHVDIRIPIPKIYQEIINDPVFTEEWKDAIDLELRVLISNSTWTKTVPPKDVNLISSRWVFDVKYIPTGEMEHFKAYLITKGFL